MQVSPRSTGLATSTPSGIVDQLKRQVSIVADGSGASDEEKVAAYTSIMRSMAQSANTGSGWYQSSTQADRDALNDIMQNSSIAKRVQAAADNFNRAGMSGSRESNVAAKNLERFNGMSSIDQQLVVAGTALSGGVEDFRSFLENNAQAREAQIAVDRAENSRMASSNLVEVTLSDDAKATLAQSQNGTEADAADPAAAAVASLARGGEDDGVAGAALKMLRKAAEQRAEAREPTKGEERGGAEAEQTNGPYEAGRNVDARI